MYTHTWLIPHLLHLCHSCYLHKRNWCQLCLCWVVDWHLITSEYVLWERGRWVLDSAQPPQLLTYVLKYFKLVCSNCWQSEIVSPESHLCKHVWFHKLGRFQSPVWSIIVFDLMTNTSLNHSNLISSNCLAISSLKHTSDVFKNPGISSPSYLCMFKGRYQEGTWVDTSGPQFLFWKRSCKCCCSVQILTTVGQTCIQSAYQLIIITVVKKEQTAKLEAKTVLWEIRCSSTLCQGRAESTTRRRKNKFFKLRQLFSLCCAPYL